MNARAVWLGEATVGDAAGLHSIARSSAPVAAAATIVVVAGNAVDLARGKASAGEFVTTSAKAAGRSAGAWAGAELGALIGTAMYPGLGTAVGGVIGGERLEFLNTNDHLLHRWRRTASSGKLLTQEDWVERNRGEIDLWMLP